MPWCVRNTLLHVALVLPVAVCCSVLQCDALCCSVCAVNTLLHVALVLPVAV